MQLRFVVWRLAPGYFFAEDFFAGEAFFAVLFLAAEPAGFFAADLDDAFFAVLFFPVDLAADFADDFFAADFFEPLAVLVAISYLFSFKFW